MLISLTGSGGVGKTTVFEEIKKQHPDWQYFSEGVRRQMPAFGYKNPYEVVDSIGIGAFELMNINTWSIIDPRINTLLDPKINIITDRSAVDNFAYFLTLKNSENDRRFEELIKRMSSYYAGLVDFFVYFPVGVFPLQNDEMRLGDKKYQEAVDRNIFAAFDELRVPDSKVYKLKSADIKNRVDEICSLLS